ncbi:hypothetical protein BGZ60DRAFT_234213 [Tricladium varicosporioides]|nr:hypothetical protein BGZ60DRAFT_234213 [Hymenoscyphus varicosporioides]
MAVQSRVVAVTGANKGIGLAIVRALALQYPASPLRAGPLTIYLTARSVERGSAALDSLNQDQQVKSAKVLVQDGGDTTIKFRELDISDSKSIQSFSEFLKREHPEGIDALVNNAGIAMTGFDNNVVKETLHTNYYGTLQMTQSILPQIRPGGRLVNVASMAGLISGRYSSSLRNAFVSASQTSVEACNSLMEKFAADVKAGNHQAEGWPSTAYSVSKAGEIAYTKLIAGEEARRGREVLVNVCCPGWVVTDMTKGKGTKTVDQGAMTPTLLALGDIKGVTGEFWQHERIVEW